ncbi:MAG TPA: hypothetical protein VG502_18470 [Flexivirga sp.]|nr:hypothetical protein [Flexivirga sp.]
MEHTTSDPRERIGLVTLVTGAALLAVARLLADPGGSPADRIEQMTHHDVQVTVSALCAVTGFAALMAGLLTVASAVRGRGAILAAVGSGLVIAGGVGFAVLSAVDFSTLAATHAGPRSAMVSYLGALDSSPGILIVTGLAMVGYMFGPFVVTLAGRRAGFVPRWLPWATLAVLILQPVAEGAGGPSLTRYVDSVFQLALVAICWVLARCTGDRRRLTDR